MKQYLDFESPIAELEKRVEELSVIAGYEEEVNKLKSQIEKLKTRIYSNLTPWQKVLLARHPARPYALDYINLITTDFVELSGDRYFADDKAVVGGLAKISVSDSKYLSVVIIGTQKGRETKEKIFRNFGMPHPEGYRKALRLMKLAEKFNLPVVTLVDTPGAYPGVGAEERGQAEAIAKNLREMAKLEVPIIAIITGEGGSGGALALAVGNRILMMEYAIYSVISPEGCASILWRDPEKAPEAAEALKLTAQDLYQFGIIDEIIPEPLGGAHHDYHLAAQYIKNSIIKNLSELQNLSPEELVNQRIEKFRSFGIYFEV
ncbi:MAG: acetyl-CoA carboxylase carboxyltransferase subunit alpha [candidate division WOR-3 bacterium]|nr:acetyl-CoA carboxylase carboxyltransferase subunit alpha [candidate division WOR-3 bacterium]MCX7757057.1 acetyl-CoA carboxylase carboxyltransferase subunit alpha [candidate division WOR-3 bacterium]MDW7987244.1 acetyl-CoA carboxylase carboxyltransferase subunit alpha [candidate division WOR-3 bacterium]